MVQLGAWKQTEKEGAKFSHCQTAGSWLVVISALKGAPCSYPSLHPVYGVVLLESTQYIEMLIVSWSPVSLSTESALM